MIKAVWYELGDRPPPIHLLDELWLGVQLQMPFEISEKALEKLSPMGVIGRYPSVRTTTEDAIWATEFCLETCTKLKSWLETRV